MSGRPPVAGLLALAVAVLLTVAFTAPPAAAQIRVPLPGEDSKPKVDKKKRYVPPTLPYRNPTRVTAGISADALSPPQAENSEAAAVAGTSSSASVSLALPRKVASRAADDAEAPAETAGAPSDDAAPASAADDPAPPTEPEQAEPASEPKEEQPAAEPEQAADRAAEDETPAETAEVAPAAEPEPAPDPVDAVTETPPPGPDDVQEAAQDAADPVEIAEATPDAAATVDAAEAVAPDEIEAPSEPTMTAAVPTQDASVVLDVAPPPDEALVASDEPAGDEVPVAGAEKAETAALTPPDAPAPPAAAADDGAGEVSGDTPLDTAPSEDEKVEAAEPEAAPAEAAPAPKDEDRIAPEAAGTSGEGTDSAAVDEDDAADATLEAPPPPPPAHPIVAEIRAKLAEPGQYKSVAASDLEALKAFYGTYEGPPLWIGDAGFTEKAQSIVAEIAKADDWGLEAASFDLPETDLPATPNAYADDELQLSIAILNYARDAQIGRLTPSKASKLFDQHPSLRDPKTVLTEIAAAEDPSAYLTSLHPQHDQFKRLRLVLRDARAKAKATGVKPSNDREVQLIIINMERWRWMPRQLGGVYVWNNVPEFVVRVVKNGKTIYLERTIVGQLKYATVLFSAPMRNIVFHPNWTVPPTIVKEDLAPKLQGPGSGGFFGNSKTNTLRRYGLSVSYKGKPIDADSVDWNNVNIHAYTFTQDPGPANVLGKFKFNFPNRHAIYMHDTVQPELFAERIRTLSHGCIRVNEPERFATLLLSEDKGWSAAQVRSLVAKNESTAIALNRHVPVHLTYFTAAVDEDGRLNTFGDIYGIDNGMAGKLFDNPARFPVPVEAAVAETSPQPRQRQRAGDGIDNFISGLFGN